MSKKKGWTNLKWCSTDDKLNPFMREINRYQYLSEKTKYQLVGRPKNCNSTSVDYSEAIIVQIMNKNYTKTKGYKWVKDCITKGYVRDDNFIFENLSFS